MCDSDQSINRNGDTALHYAVQAQSRELVELLLSFGAQINVKNNKFGSFHHKMAIVNVFAVANHPRILHINWMQLRSQRCLPIMHPVTTSKLKHKNENSSAKTQANNYSNRKNRKLSGLANPWWMMRTSAGLNPPFLRRCSLRLSKSNLFLLYLFPCPPRVTNHQRPLRSPPRKWIRQMSPKLCVPKCQQVQRSSLGRKRKVWMIRRYIWSKRSTPRANFPLYAHHKNQIRL